jgi:hypothetical protein
MNAEKWWIIDVDMNNMSIAQRDLRDYRYAQRPADANPENEDVNTPWFQHHEHIHTPAEDGVWGAHVCAADEREACVKTLALLEAAEVGHSVVAAVRQILHERYGK